MSFLRISELARTTGTNAPTIRYYEEIGLLPRAWRQEGNQRRYGVEDVARLGFIRRCRDFGFSVDQVRILVSLTADETRSCAETRDMAQEHLNVVRNEIVELHGLEASLAALVARCDATCVGGPGPDCTIQEDLAAVRPRKSCCG